MNVLKRAWLYVTRKKKKSLIMLLILFSIATATLSIISVKKAAGIAKASIQKELNNSFEVYSLGMGVPKEVLDTISKVNGIANVNRMSMSGGVIDGVNLIPSTSTYFQELDKGYEDFVNIEGNDESQLNKKFTIGSFKLVSGRHITKEDTGKVLMHQELAQSNNLKIGDKITVKGTEKNLYSLKKDGSITLEIVGLFDSSNNQKDMSMIDMSQNLLIMDNSSVMELDGFTNGNITYVSAEFFIKESNQLHEVIANVKKLPLDLSEYDIYGSNETFSTMTNSINKLDEIIHTISIGVIILGIVILSLVLTFWIRGRIHEIGILLSIGTSKTKVISQFLIEVFMIAVVAFSMAYFSGQAIAQGVGNQLVEQASNSSKKEFYSDFSGPGMLAPDEDSQLITKTIDKIDVQVTPYELFDVYLIGAMIIVISVSVASMSIVRLQPKEILSKN